MGFQRIVTVCQPFLAKYPSEVPLLEDFGKVKHLEYNSDCSPQGLSAAQ
jgi:hypothetical protein